MKNKSSMMWVFRIVIFVWTVQQSKASADCQPKHVHLSYGDTSTDVSVMWETNDHCSAKVEYGEGPYHLNLESVGTTKDGTHCQSQNCSFAFFHWVILKKLNPLSTVYYRPISDGISVGPYYFHVPGQKEKEPLRFIFKSVDYEHNSESAFSGLQKTIYQHPHAALFLMNNAQQLVCKKKESVLAEMEPFATNLPLMIGADDEPNDAESCSNLAFSMPGLDWSAKSGQKRWYSFDIGIVHLVVYSSKVFLEKDSAQGLAQQAWMVKDLEKVKKRRTTTPWVIAVGSDPMYCHDDGFDRDCGRNDSLIRHGLEDLFHHFAVDLVLEVQPGFYERMWPHYKRVLLSKSYQHPESPVEIILPQGASQEAAHDLTNDTAKQTTADWTARRVYSNSDGYAHVSVVNSSHLYFEWRQSREVIIDSFWVVQDQHGNFSLASLPHNVSHKINQSIIAMGGKPGTYDFISTLTPKPSGDGEGWSKYSLWFGLGLVGVTILVGLGIATIRSYLRQKRSKASRRWREVDRHQGGSSSGRFYSMASESDSDGEHDHDFEIDMFERGGSKSESKLLTSY